MKKILFVATIESHILNFHIPFIRYFQEKGFEVHVATKLGKRKKELESVNVICHYVEFERSQCGCSTSGHPRARRATDRLLLSCGPAFVGIASKLAADDGAEND